MIVSLKHNQSKVFKQCKVGFSWTFFFFRCLVPLFRGDALWFCISLLVDCFTLLIGGIALSFLYNGIYIKSLLEKGYLPADENSKLFLQRKGYITE